MTVLERAEAPWRTVEGIEFRSLTVVAHKGKEGPCWDQKHAVVYRGPFRQVEDDDGHVLRRGVRTAVCEKTFQIYAAEPYRALRSRGAAGAGAARRGAAVPVQRRAGRASPARDQGGGLRADERRLRERLRAR